MEEANEMHMLDFALVASGWNIMYRCYSCAPFHVTVSEGVEDESSNFTFKLNLALFKHTFQRCDAQHNCFFCFGSTLFSNSNDAPSISGG